MAGDSGRSASLEVCILMGPIFIREMLLLNWKLLMGSPDSEAERGLS